MIVNFIFQNKSKGLTLGFLPLFLGVLFLFSLTNNAFAQVSGTVFRDFNANGLKENTATYNEPFAEGVIVTAYNTSNTAVASFKTNASGTFSIPASGSAYNNTLGSNTGFVASGTSVRLEFTLSNTVEFSSFAGTDNSSSVQFVTAPAASVKFSINYPGDYWSTTGQPIPKLLVPHYINGTYNGNSSTDPAILSVGSNQNTMTPVVTTVATKLQVGAVWGEGYQSNKDRFFFTAFTKRHIGFGPKGPGGVYIANGLAGSYSIGGSFDLQGVTTANGVNLDFGSVTRNTTLGDDNFLSVVKTDPNRDLDAFDKVGKTSMGGVDVDETTNKMFIVNCFQRSIITMDVSGVTATLNNAAAATLTPLTNSYAISSLPGAPACTGSTLRPWAILIYKGKGYLGAVCDNASFGYILSFDPNNIAAGFQTVLTLDMSYSQGRIWHPWVTNYASTGLSMTPGLWDLLHYNQPIIGSLSFNEDGSMDISVMSRWGHQLGNHNYLPVAGSTYLAYSGAYGDLLHACFNATTQSWTMEGEASCGVNFPLSDHAWNGYGRMNGGTAGEYYDDLSGDGTDENGQGGLTKIMGTQKVYQVVTDPLVIGTAPDPAYFSTGGVHGFNTITGDRNQAIRLQSDAGNTTFGKASGLGDIESNLGPAPIEIGNRVWTDTDADGIQDPGESGINGVVVKLYLGATQVGQTTTANGGLWYFNSSNVNMNGATAVLPQTTYTVRVESAQFPPSGVLTTANIGGAGQPDVRDSDASLVSGNAEISYMTGNAGENNHTLDIGFFTCTAPSAITFNQVAPTCTGATANNNGTISLATATNGTHFGISTLNAASYDGPTTIAGATALGALPMVIKSSVPNAGGTYRVRIFNGADACFTDQTVTVTAVTCNSFAAVNGVQITVCSGINMNLSSAPIGGTAPYTYLWSGPSGFTANVQYPVVPYVTTANSGSYTVTVTESTGMTATATTNVTILPPGDPACFTVCTNPTGISFGQQTATCTGLVANNNGSISITGATNATHVGISSLNAAVYDGPTTIATSIPLTAFPMLIKSSIPNTGGTYLVRLYNLYDACYTERIVTVAAVNCFSAIASSTVSVCYGSILNLVSSPNGGAAPYTYVWSGPSAFTSNQQNPTINPVTNANIGTYSVTVTEGTGMTAVATTIVNVLAVGSPGCGTLGPVAVNDAKTIPEGGTAFGSVGTNDSDPDNTLAQLTFTFGSPTSGTFVGQPNGTYLFTPSSPDFNGIVIIPYTVCDPTSLCDNAILTITVTPVNDPPIAVNDNATVISGNSVVVPVLNNDSNGPDGAIVPSSVTVTVPALHGTTSVNTTTGAITYTPNTGYVGTDVLTYQVCDDGSPAPGACVTALVNITVVSDKDNDGIPDNTDIDDDNDGILDSNENPAGYADGGGDLDSDGTPNYKDTQNPNCGGLNTAGACTSYDKDGDGVPDQFDLDSDNDGVTDVVEAGASDSDNNGIIGTGAVPADQDQDGLADVVDASPLSGALGSIGTPNTDTDGDGKPNAEDLDSDNDGVTDILEAGGSDADNNGIVGTGATPTDTDGDGLADIADQAPATFGDTGNTTPNEDSDNDGKPDSRDLDSDNDGITDVVESGGSDADNNGIVGATVNPLDTDNDGLADIADQSPSFGDAGNTTPYGDLDNDGTPNAEDIDSDNDGLTDIVESGLPDTDNNGIVGVGQNPTDTDGDGLADVADQSGSYGDAGNANVPVNTDASGNPDYLDIDADNDGVVDVIEWQTTAGYTVPAGADIDGDGLDNAYDQFTGFGDAGNTNTPTNSDGTDTPDYIDTNSDNDAQTDAIEGWDTNGDNVANTLPANADADNDGLDDAYDVNDAATNPTNGTTPSSYPDLDAPGTPERDWRELVPEICGNGIDDDGDGSIDENCPNYTPTIEMDNVTFLTGFVSRDFVINISEINNASSSGQIVLKMPKISGFTYAFSPTTTLANVYGGSAVDNSLWDMTQNSLFVTLTLKPGVVLPAYNIYSIGMTVTRKANIPTQTNQPVTVTIVDKSGADNNDFDNTYNVVIKAQ